MKVRDWYFQGWERDRDGALCYTGEYYTLPGSKPKTVPLCLGGGLIVLYLLTAFFPSEGGMWRFAAVPQLLELIPVIYLVLGAFCLLRAKQPMVYRDWYASWRRIRVSALWSMIFTCAMSVTEIVYLVMYGRDAPLLPELLFLVRVLGCAALSIFLLRYMDAHPCSRSISK